MMAPFEQASPAGGQRTRHAPGHCDAHRARHLPRFAPAPAPHRPAQRACHHMRCEHARRLLPSGQPVVAAAWLAGFGAVVRALAAGLRLPASSDPACPNAPLCPSAPRPTSTTTSPRHARPCCACAQCAVPPRRACGCGYLCGVAAIPRRLRPARPRTPPLHKPAVRPAAARSARMLVGCCSAGGYPTSG
ncbi:unnamed protein product [Urochloa decumbens]|uniref:Uncharacterized protein n=1 Tax=Urochloa decumbens TaxID=240449 RepID=A0ABC9E0M1_9POAL